MRDISTFATSVSLPEPPSGWFDYGFSILQDGSLAMLRSDRNIHAEYAEWAVLDHVANPTPPPPWGQLARLSTFDGVQESAAIEVPLAFAPTLGRLADGRWLVVARRAAAGEQNGHLYQADGTPAGEILIGDGVEHLRCAPDGSIWVGYFDEGIFSQPSDENFSPISSSGIARLAADGSVVWAFNTPERANTYVADCDAMTLDGDTMWSCFHSKYPIARVEHGVVSMWSNECIGAKALAVDGPHVLLAGGYGADAYRVAILTLERGTARCEGKLQLEALNLSPDGLLQGHGDTLHIVANGLWTRMTVANVRAALASEPMKQLEKKIHYARAAVHLLAARNGLKSLVRLMSGEEHIVWNIDWGRHSGDDFDHVIANSSPSIDGEEVRYFYANEVVQITDELGRVVFAAMSAE